MVEALRETALTDSLRIYFVAKAVGWEKFTLAPDGSGRRLDADFEYTDRGRQVGHSISWRSLDRV